MDKAKDIFEEFKEKKDWVVEGVVARTLNSNRLSCKIMNNFYDSKK